MDRAETAGIFGHQQPSIGDVLVAGGVRSSMDPSLVALIERLHASAQASGTAQMDSFESTILSVSPDGRADVNVGDRAAWARAAGRWLVPAAVPPPPAAAVVASYVPPSGAARLVAAQSPVVAGPAWGGGEPVLTIRSRPLTPRLAMLLMAAVAMAMITAAVVVELSPPGRGPLSVLLGGVGIAILFHRTPRDVLTLTNAELALQHGQEQVIVVRRFDIARVERDTVRSSAPVLLVYDRSGAVVMRLAETVWAPGDLMPLWQQLGVMPVSAPANQTPTPTAAGAARVQAAASPDIRRPMSALDTCVAMLAVLAGAFAGILATVLADETSAWPEIGALAGAGLTIAVIVRRNHAAARWGTRWWGGGRRLVTFLIVVVAGFCLGSLIGTAIDPSREAMTLAGGYVGAVAAVWTRSRIGRRRLRRTVSAAGAEDPRPGPSS